MKERLFINKNDSINFFELGLALALILGLFAGVSHHPSQPSSSLLHAHWENQFSTKTSGSHDNFSADFLK